MTLIFSSRDSSKFIDWVETRREISIFDLEKLHPGTISACELDDRTKKIFIYRGEHWIAQNNDTGIEGGDYFWTFIERDDYSSNDIEDLELRLYLWAQDEGCAL